MTKLTPAYYLTMSGRISRSEYWLYFQLPLVVLYVPYLWVALAGPADIIATIVQLLTLAMSIVALLGGIRRFHDRDKSGWWMLLSLIPIVGTIWIIVELGFLKGTPGANRFGADPTVG